MLGFKLFHLSVRETLRTVYPKKYAHGFVVLCFVVVMQSFIMNSHEVFIHIHQGCFAGTGAIVRLPQCQWSKPDGYGKISQCITTTKHSKAKTVCIFLGIYCKSVANLNYFVLVMPQNMTYMTWKSWSNLVRAMVCQVITNNAELLFFLRCSGDGLMPSGSKPLLDPILTQFYVAVGLHWATLIWLVWLLFSSCLQRFGTH